MLDLSTLTQKRYAVCVGINIYASSSELRPLKFAENDAGAIDEVLGTLGFDQRDRVLLLGEQATLAAINEALNEMMDRAEENDLVVFYFAGHGAPLYFDQDNTRDVFLASYDFDPQKLEQRRSLRTEQALGMERLRRVYFESQGSRKRLFLFDCCYSGEFAGFRSDDKEAVQQHMNKMLESKSTGRVALLSCLPEQVAVETSKHGHGKFTYYLLQALQGKAPAAVRSDGWLTVNTLFEYLSQQLQEMQRPVLSGIQHDVFEIVCYPALVRPEVDRTPVLHGKSLVSERYAYLRAMLADHTDFLSNRLGSFVGRTQELEAIRQRIQDKMLTGGYVIITGQAGQGKSSIMAKLVDDYGINQVAFHFIPFPPGPNHQVGLLRNLMARLILKYQLSEVYATAGNRATLRDYFANLLREVAAKGGQEVIFIDGLDQLEEDMNGFRDLSFLPANPPAGIVFVLATRPDDTLQPLVLLKPHEPYPLPNLQRKDFDLILHHRNVVIERHLADQFYQAMGENALYLDLIAKELYENTGLSPREMIAHIANNPDNIFTLSITRFKRQPLEWREVVKPTLGVLLAAREPLALWHLRQILSLDDDRLRDGISRLGGLLRESGQRCYSLFHLKLQEYLRQDEQRPDKDYVFATDEEEQYHDRLVKWCEPGSLDRIWKDTLEKKEQGRREYARYHYIEHLYAARQYEKLFRVLDDGVYGKEKENYDRTNRSYIHDLNLGRRAAIRYGEEIENDFAALPLLWKYTLLRSSLRSQADNYPESLFQAFLLLNREREVLGLVELITEDRQRVKILNLLGIHFAKKSMQQESYQIFFRSVCIAQEIQDPSHRAEALSDIAQALAQAQQWEQAEEVTSRIEDPSHHAKALRRIAQTLAEAQQWEQAKEIANGIEDPSHYAEALSDIAWSLAEAQQWEQAKEIASGIEDPSRHTEALRRIAQALAEAQQWEQASSILGQAEEVVSRIEDSYERGEALTAIARVLVQNQQWERADSVLRQAQEVARGINHSWYRVWTLEAITDVLIQAQQWERAEVVTKEIMNISDSIMSAQWWALSRIVQALAQAQQWKQAQAAANMIEDVSDRAEALSAIAGELAQVQQWERASDMFNQAEEVANGIEDASDRAGALSTIAGELARAQQWEQAQAVANKIEDPYHYAKALSTIAGELVQAQQWERASDIFSQAEEVANRIEDASQHVLVLSGIVKLLTQARQWERAEEVVKSIEDPSKQAEALIEIVQALAQAQQWERAEAVLEQAEEVSKGIEDVWSPAEALCAIAQVLAKTQQWEHAGEILEQVEKNIRKIKNAYRLVVALCDIAKVLILIHQREQAETILEQAEAISGKIVDTWERSQAFSGIVQVLLLLQHWERARAVANEIKEEYSWMSTHDDIVQALAQAQQWEQAEEVALEMEDDDSYQSGALCGIVQALAQMQRWDEAESLARIIVNEYSWAQALSAIAQALAQAQLWERADEVAEGIRNGYSRSMALSGIARALAQAQRWERAEATLRQAEEMAQRSEDAYYEVEALNRIAQGWMHIRREGRAETVLKQAEEVIRKIEENSHYENDDYESPYYYEDSYHKAKVLSGIALLWMQAQQKERAEAILRQAEKVASGSKKASDRARALGVIARELAQAQQWHLLIGVIQRAWLAAETREYAFHLLPLAYEVIKVNPHLGVSLAEVFAQVDAFIAK